MIFKNYYKILYIYKYILISFFIITNKIIFIYRSYTILTIITFGLKSKKIKATYSKIPLQKTKATKPMFYK